MDCFRGLPFKVGDSLELKSFDQGYRGAWFPCEIKETGEKGVAVDLIAYPDDDVTWMKTLYDKVPGRSSSRTKVELMLRPQYPPLYSEAEAPDLNSLSEVIVVTNGAWKVGDLVDWLCDGAYWSGTIIKFLEDDKVKIKSPPLPMGEGLVYEASCMELRPSLKWSPKSGWTVPVPRGKKNYRPCAQLIKPVNQEQNANAHRSSEHPLPSPLGEKGTDNENTNVSVEGERGAEGGLKDVDGKQSCEDGVPEMEEARMKDAVEGERGAEEGMMDVDGKQSCEDGVPEMEEAGMKDAVEGERGADEGMMDVDGKGSCEDGVPEMEEEGERGAEEGMKDVDGSGSRKDKVPETEEAAGTECAELNINIPLNSSKCDSIEASIMDLEELMCRIKWIKTILNPPAPNSARAGWKFLQVRGTASGTTHTVHD